MNYKAAFNITAISLLVQAQTYRCPWNQFVIFEFPIISYFNDFKTWQIFSKTLKNSSDFLKSVFISV